MGEEKGFKAAFRKVDSFLNRGMDIVHLIDACAMGAFMLILLIQVIMRFVFNNPVYGLDEMVICLIIWSMAIGNVVVYWQNEHAVIEFVAKMLPRGFKKLSYHVTNLTVLITSYVFVPGGYQLFRMQAKQRPIGGLPFSKAYYYALPMIVMGVMLLTLSAFRLIEYLVLNDDKIMRPFSGEGGRTLD